MAVPPSKPPTPLDVPGTSRTGSLQARLATPLDALSGIGPRRALALRRAYGDDARLSDLLLALPRRIEHLVVRDLADPVPDQPVAFAFVADGPTRRFGGRGERLLGRSGDVAVELRWFRPSPFRLARRLAEGGPHLLFARVRVDADGMRAADHPQVLRQGDAGRSRARYAGLDGRLERVVAAQVAALVRAWPDAADWLDEATRARLDVPPTAAALAVLHGLVDGDAIAARRRLAVDEWAAFRLDLAAARITLGREARPVAVRGRLAAALARALPFHATPSQIEAHEAIRADLASGRRMRRLVNGDVGSGKTLVAALAAADTIEAGRQVALMAPSETLARQHAATLDGWLRPLGVEVGLLTGSVGAAARRSLHTALARGEVDLLVGTHALFEARVPFADLGLVVVDEQHRFGVRQRLALAAKGTDAHVLTLSATPIPRSLALALQGEIDVSRLANRPGTGGNVVTRAVPATRLDEVVARLAAAVDAGARAFWITASIEGTEHDAGALARHAALAELRPGSVALLTGRMAAAERERALDAFHSGRSPLLVATTVVEVGIDVPDASIVVIEAAERFGLAQLHQLRGRVGRGGQPASCVLLHAAPLAPSQRRRLDLLRRCHDGMVLAEADLRWRGEGDRLGVRQAGDAGFRFVDWAEDGAMLAGIDEPTIQAAATGSFDPRWLFRPQSTATGGLVAG